jgi:hypothetical protein
MRYKGINYDIGTKTITGLLTRETFDLAVVTREIEIIKNDLHCNAIRISGLDIDRIAQASEIALKLGLTVWFSPSLQYENRESTLNYLVEASQAAEKLRKTFPDIIFVSGCELSLFTSGFVTGKTWSERLKKMFSPLSFIKNSIGIKRTYNRRLNTFLSQAVTEIRKRYHGQITYCSGTWEKVDWEIFDIIGVDLYRSSFNKSTYVKELQRYQQAGKPMIIMEFGCCAYEGADEKGAMGWAIVDWQKTPPEIKGNYLRDEDTQAHYLLELLEIFDSQNVYGAFVFTFISYNYFHSSDPVFDLDMASFGIVKSLKNHDGVYSDDLSWAPKKSFFAVSDYYKSH